MITLAGIELPDLWFDPSALLGIEVSGRLAEARDGTAHIFNQSAKYRAADLVGSEDMAWMTYLTMKQIDALVIPGGQYDLSYEGVLYSVAFRTWEPPVISGTPLVFRPNQEDTDYFKNIRIKLIIT
jgi:hypothetical protein